MATAPPTDASEPPKKGKKKLILILVALLVVLGLAGGGALFLMKKNQAEADEDEGDGQPARTTAAARDPKFKPTFVQLDLFTVNLADRDIDRYAQVQMALELRDEKSAELIKSYMPVIRNNVLTVLSYKSSGELLERYGKQRLSREIRTEIARALSLAPPEVDEEELPPPANAAPPAAEAPAKDKSPRKRPRKLAPEEYSPVIGVHFSNFIIQ